MLLWTIQPLEIWRMIRETGVYRCDPAQSSMQESEFTEQYDWLIRQMKKRIGPPPEGVIYPVWAWYKQNGKRKKPDLRGQRWRYGAGDEDHACIEFEIADDRVLLSDFDSWHTILNNCLFSDSEADADEKDAYYNALPAEEQKIFQEKNWEQVFDITPFENDRTRRGDWVQATIWELRKDMVRDVRFFKTGKRKNQNMKRRCLT